MGIFDYVVGLSVNCPKCGKEHTRFQTKDGECYLNSVDYRQVLDFYKSCDCGYWIEYRRKPAKDISDFLVKIE